MKTCPTCNRTYDDDSLSFCLNDGAVLINQVAEPPATQRIPAPDTNPNAATLYSGPTWTPPQVQPTQPHYQAAWAEPPPPKRGRMGLALAGIAALLLLVGGVGAGIMLTRNGFFGDSNGNTKVSSLETDKGASSNNKSGTNSTARPTPTPAPTPTPTPDVPAAEKLGMVGNWSGLQNGAASTLSIVAGEGNSFSGTKVTGAYQLSIAGTVDPATRRVTINETKVLKGQPYSNGKGWSLGKERGMLSADGRKLSGTGTDQYNPKTPYKWSYTKK